MGKQSSRQKRSSAKNLGKGKVTPVQVAFIVDRYLSDNRFSETRSVFRSEASSLIPKSSFQEAPKSLLTLDDMLNEYISLKEHKVILDQERVRLEQEKSRVQNLLHGMQDVMNAYNASANAPAPALQAATTPPVAAVAPQPNTFTTSPSGCPVYNTPNARPMSTMPFNKRVDHGNFSMPFMSQSLATKRKGLEASVGAASTVRKKRSKTMTQSTTSKAMRNLPEPCNAVSLITAQPSSGIQSSPSNRATSEPLVQGSSVAKCLFNQAVVSPPTNSNCPKTPPQGFSPQSDTSVSPPEEVTPQEITPTNCTIISKERITVSPMKQMACYTVERSHCISSSSPAKINPKMSNKRDHVKGRLNFDDSDALACLDKPAVDESSASPSGSEKEIDPFDLDFPNLDVFGENFSFSELLVDLDFDCEGTGYPCLPTSSVPLETISGSSPESGDGNREADQLVSAYSSTVTEVISGKDMSAQGPDAMTTVKSVTKCIRILSPVKNCRQRITSQTTD